MKDRILYLLLAAALTFNGYSHWAEMSKQKTQTWIAIGKYYQMDRMFWELGKYHYRYQAYYEKKIRELKADLQK